MGNFMVSSIIVAIIALAIIKIVKEKRKGNKCIGCAISGKCDSDEKSKSSALSAHKIAIKEVV